MRDKPPLFALGRSKEEWRIEDLLFVASLLCNNIVVFPIVDDIVHTRGTSRCAAHCVFNLKSFLSASLFRCRPWFLSGSVPGVGEAVPIF